MAKILLVEDEPDNRDLIRMFLESDGHSVATAATGEDAVAEAAGTGRRGFIEPTSALSLEPTRLDGNNVNLDTETPQSIDTNLRYQLALRAVDDRFGLVRSAIR